MPQNATEVLLPANQETALANLTAGATITAAAHAAKVDRSTVYRWMKEDPQFIARLNFERRLVREAVRDRLLAMAGIATETVMKALERGDSATAMQLLIRLGILAPPQDGPLTSENADMIEAEIWAAKVNAALKRTNL